MQRKLFIRKKTIKKKPLKKDSPLIFGPYEIPQGSLVGISGPVGSGKTSAALTLAWQHQQNGKKVVMFDPETAVNIERFRLNPSQIDIYNLHNSTQTVQALDMIIEQDDADLIILDSIQTILIDDEDYNGMTMAVLSRFMTRLIQRILPKLKAFNKTCIITSTEMRGLNPYGPNSNPPYTNSYTNMLSMKFRTHAEDSNHLQITCSKNRYSEMREPFILDLSQFRHVPQRVD